MTDATVWSPLPRLHRRVGPWHVVLAPDDPGHPLTLNDAAAAVLFDPNANPDPATRATLLDRCLLAPSTERSPVPPAELRLGPVPAGIARPIAPDELVAALLTLDTPLGDPRPLGTAHFTDADWSACFERLRVGALVGAASAAITQGWIDPPAEWTERLTEAHLQISVRAVLVERAFLRAHAVLSEDALDPIVLKGVAVAHQDYADPAWRQFADADILIPDGRLGAALDALAAAGFTPDFERGRATAALKAVGMRDQDGFSVDIHQRLANGLFGRLANPLACDRSSFELAGRSITSLSAAGRLAHAILHARRDLAIRARTGTLRDLALLPMDVAAVAQLERWRMVTTCSTVADDIAARSPAIAQHLRGRTQRRTLLDRAAAAIAPRSVVDEVATTLLTPGPRAKAAYVRARVWPGTSFAPTPAGPD